MKCYKYGDNVDTDVIIPARYLHIGDIRELASHAMEDIDEAFSGTVEPGDVIIGGRNFGCGSSREHAPLILRERGVKCVIAESYSRIFFRNSINIGLPILTCPEAAKAIQAGETITVNLQSGTIQRDATGQTWVAEPLPPFLEKIRQNGGLLNYLKERQKEHE